MSDYRQGTEYPPIIGCDDNQISVCWSKHMILSLFKTEIRVWKSPPIIGAADKRSDDNRILSVYSNSFISWVHGQM